MADTGGDGTSLLMDSFDTSVLTGREEDLMLPGESFFGFSTSPGGGVNDSSSSFQSAASVLFPSTSFQPNASLPPSPIANAASLASPGDPNSPTAENAHRNGSDGGVSNQECAEEGNGSKKERVAAPSLLQLLEAAVAANADCAGKGTDTGPDKKGRATGTSKGTSTDRNTRTSECIDAARNDNEQVRLPGEQEEKSGDSCSGGSSSSSRCLEKELDTSTSTSTTRRNNPRAGEGSPGDAPAVSATSTTSISVPTFRVTRLRSQALKTASKGKVLKLKQGKGARSTAAPKASAIGDQVRLTRGSRKRRAPTRLDLGADDQRSLVPAKASEKTVTEVNEKAVLDKLPALSCDASKDGGVRDISAKEQTQAVGNSDINDGLASVPSMMSPENGIVAGLELIPGFEDTIDGHFVTALLEGIESQPNTCSDDAGKHSQKQGEEEEEEEEDDDDATLIDVTEQTNDAPLTESLRAACGLPGSKTTKQASMPSADLLAVTPAATSGTPPSEGTITQSRPHGARSSQRDRGATSLATTKSSSQPSSLQPPPLPPPQAPPPTSSRPPVTSSRQPNVPPLCASAAPMPPPPRPVTSPATSATRVVRANVPPHAGSTPSRSGALSNARGEGTRPLTLTKNSPTASRRLDRDQAAGSMGGSQSCSAVDKARAGRAYPPNTCEAAIPPSNPTSAKSPSGPSSAGALRPTQTARERAQEFSQSSRSSGVQISSTPAQAGAVTKSSGGVGVAPASLPRKAALRFTPRDHVTQNKVAEQGYNPAQQLKAPLHKPIDAVFKFMLKKWTKVAYGDLNNIRIVFEPEAPRLPPPQQVSNDGVLGVNPVSSEFVWGAARGGESLLDLASSLPDATRDRLCKEEVLDLTYTFVPGPLGLRQPLLPNALMGNIPPPSTERTKYPCPTGAGRRAVPTGQFHAGQNAFSVVTGQRLAGRSPQVARGEAPGASHTYFARQSTRRVSAAPAGSMEPPSGVLPPGHIGGSYPKHPSPDGSEDASAGEAVGSTWIDVGCESSRADSESPSPAEMTVSKSAPLDTAPAAPGGFLALMHTAAVASGIAERQERASPRELPATRMAVSSGPVPPQAVTSPTEATACVSPFAPPASVARPIPADSSSILEGIVDGDNGDGGSKACEAGATAGSALMGEDTCMALFGGNEANVELLLDSPSQHPESCLSAGTTKGATSVDDPAVCIRDALAAIDGLSPLRITSDLSSAIPRGTRDIVDDNVQEGAPKGASESRRSNAALRPGPSSRREAASSGQEVEVSSTQTQPSPLTQADGLPLRRSKRGSVTARAKTSKDDDARKVRPNQQLQPVASRFADAEMAGVSPSSRDERRTETSRNSGGEPATVGIPGGIESEGAGMLGKRPASPCDVACAKNDAEVTGVTAKACMRGGVGGDRSKRRRLAADEVAAPAKEHALGVAGSKRQQTDQSTAVNPEYNATPGGVTGASPAPTTLSSRPFAFAAAKSAKASGSGSTAKNESEVKESNEWSVAQQGRENATSSHAPAVTPLRKSSPVESPSPLRKSMEVDSASVLDLADLSISTPLKNVQTNDADTWKTFPTFLLDTSIPGGCGEEPAGANATPPEHPVTRWLERPGSRDLTFQGSAEAPALTRVCRTTEAAPTSSSEGMGSESGGSSTTGSGAAVTSSAAGMEVDKWGGKPLPTLIRLGRSMSKGVPLSKDGAGSSSIGGDLRKETDGAAKAMQDERHAVRSGAAKGRSFSSPALGSFSSVATTAPGGAASGCSRGGSTAEMAPGVSVQKVPTNGCAKNAKDYSGDVGGGGKNKSLGTIAPLLIDATTAGDGTQGAVVCRPKRRVKKGRITPTLVTSVLPTSSVALRAPGVGAIGLSKPAAGRSDSREEISQGSGNAAGPCSRA